MIQGTDDPAAARLDATVALVHGLVEVRRTALETLGLFDGEGLDHGLVQLRLVALERRHTVGAPVADGRRNPLPAAQGIEGHKAALEHRHLKQFRNGRDLVGVVVHPARAQDRRAGSAPAGIVGTAGRLAVHRHDLGPEGRGQRLHPACEAAFPWLRVQPREDAPEGVVRGNAVRQRRKRPGQACFRRPNSSTSVPRSAPQTTARAAIRSMSPGHAVGPGADGDHRLR